MLLLVQLEPRQNAFVQRFVPPEDAVPFVLVVRVLDDVPDWVPQGVLVLVGHRDSRGGCLSAAGELHFPREVDGEVGEVLLALGRLQSE